MRVALDKVNKSNRNQEGDRRRSRTSLVGDQQICVPNGAVDLTDGEQA